jgi:hypothetical protein
MGEVYEFDCAFVRADARVHAVSRSNSPSHPLCRAGSVDVVVNAPFEVDDDLACLTCAHAALRQRAAG